jgi:hypothetical protein
VNKEQRGWPAYLFGGRVRTSTAALILAFIVVWFVYEAYQPSAKPAPAPATQVVPPGFVPDPNYTWVPRTSVQEQPLTTEPTTTTTTATTTSPTSSTEPTTTTGTPSPGAPTTTSSPAPGAPPMTTTSVPPGPGPSPSPSR